MPELYMIGLFARQINKILEFYMIMLEKMNKMSEFYMIFCGIFFPNLDEGASAPAPDSYACPHIPLSVSTPHLRRFPCCPISLRSPLPSPRVWGIPPVSGALG